MKLLFTLVLTLLSLPLLSQDFAGTSGDDVLVESSDDGTFSVDKGTVVEVLGRVTAAEVRGCSDAYN